MPNVAKTLKGADVRKAMKISTFLLMTKNYADLELLISHWSMETHTFVVVWREFTPTLKDVVVISHLPLFEDHDAVCISLNKEEERSMWLLNAALRVLIKSTTYTPRSDISDMARDIEKR